MNHEVKKKLTNGRHRVIYHAHTTNTIALTFVLPLEDKCIHKRVMGICNRVSGGISGWCWCCSVDGSRWKGDRSENSGTDEKI